MATGSRHALRTRKVTHDQGLQERERRATRRRSISARGTLLSSSARNGPVASSSATFTALSPRPARDSRTSRGLPDARASIRDCSSLDRFDANRGVSTLLSSLIEIVE